MSFLNSCCCWRNLRSACIASITFILTTSFVHLMLHLALYFGWGLELGGGSGNWLTDYLYFGLYVGLAVMDAFVIIFACVALWAEVRISYRRSFMLPLLIIMPIYILYEAGTNIYFFVVMFEGLNSSTGLITVGGSSLFGNSVGTVNGIPIGTIATALVYWLVKLVIIVACYVAIMSAFQEAGYRTPAYHHHERAVDNPYSIRTNPYDMYGRGHRHTNYPPEFREYREKAMYDRTPRHHPIEYNRDYRNY